MMQLTKTFAATLKAGDRLTYTDHYGDKHTVTLLAEFGALASADGWLIRRNNGHFADRVAKLHDLQRAKPPKTRVVVGDSLQGLDRTKIVPIGTIATTIRLSRDNHPPTLYWNGEHWVVVEAGGKYYDWAPVGAKFGPEEYQITITYAPEAKK
jgi:hypothetical protein